MRASVVYVPTCQLPKACQLLIFTCQRANMPINVPKTCQLFNLVYQRANVPKTCQLFNLFANFSTWRANLPKGVPIFQYRLPNGVPVFQLFFRRIFQFLNFSVMLNICIVNFNNIWTILENLSRETKNLNLTFTRFH